MVFINARNIAIFKAVINGKSLTSLGKEHCFSNENIRRITVKMARLIRERHRLWLFDYIDGSLVPVELASYSPKFIEEMDNITNMRRNSELWCKAVDEIHLPRDDDRTFKNYVQIDTPQRYYENSKDLPPIINSVNVSELMSWAYSYLGAPNVS